MLLIRSLLFIGIAGFSAGVAAFLASADADCITGQSYHVDGGVVMQ